MDNKAIIAWIVFLTVCIEGVLSNPRYDLKEGQAVRIEYHPKYKNNARLVSSAAETD